MVVVLDTSVLYQALYGSAGAAHAILELIKTQQIKLALSIPVFTEYQAVLNRKSALADFDLSISDMAKILALLAYVGKPFDIFFLFRPNLKDETDNMFVELAIASRANFLITSNQKDFRQAELKFADFEIVTPGDFLKHWRKNESQK